MLGLKRKAAYKKRFNLLLFEGEYYFDAVGCILYLPSNSTLFNQRKQLKGRLHIGSKTIIFDPDDARHCIMRIPIRKILSVRRMQHENNDYFILNTEEIVEIESYTPYTIKKIDNGNVLGEFVFNVMYGSLVEILSLISTLHSLQKIDDTKEREDIINDMISRKEDSVKFDSSRIVDIREKPQFDEGDVVLCSQVAPLVTHSGCCMITDLRLYFQPFNQVFTDPVRKYKISDIEAMYKRRYTMRDNSLEFFFKAEQNRSTHHIRKSESRFVQESLYLSFKSTHERNMIYDLISSLKLYNPTSERSLKHMISEWVAGNVSNFDYLTFLNQYAGRSFQDLTQYPVFPWIISDYTSDTLDFNDSSIFRDLSKPIGALNPARLEYFKTRRDDMPEEMYQGKYPFLYGTHYSTPGYVLYWLIRRAPEYQLRLQNGKFDHADRLFTSIERSWQSCNTSYIDVKELIPEFYYTGNDGNPGSFLTNEHDLELGFLEKQKEEVDDVELPPWANYDPQQFINMNRRALESDYVSNNLHKWIDLIFGTKQNGEAAVEADNIFYYLTYEGAVDMDKLSDQEKRSVEAQIREFGQTPKQILFNDHPHKGQNITSINLENLIIEKKQEVIHNNSNENNEPKIESSLIDDVLNNSAMSALDFITESIKDTYNTIASNISSFKLPQENNELKKDTKLVNIIDNNSDLESLDFDELTKTIDSITNENDYDIKQNDENDKLPELATLTLNLDNENSTFNRNGGSKAFYHNESKISSNLKTFKSSHLLSLHHDSVTCIAISKDEKYVFSGSQDANLRIFSLEKQNQIRSSRIGDLSLSCIAPVDAQKLLIGSWDNSIYLYDISFGSTISEIMAHDDAVSCLSMLGSNKFVTGSWDSTVKIWEITSQTINNYPLLEFDEHDSEVRCLSALDNLIISGSEDGLLVLNDIRQENPVWIHETNVENISALSFLSDKSICYASKNGNLSTINISKPEKIMNVNTKEKITALATNGNTIITGGPGECLRSWNPFTGEELDNVRVKCGGINSLSITKSILAVASNQKKNNVEIFSRKLKIIIKICVFYISHDLISDPSISGDKNGS